ncbi:hypothetical protein Nepgr_033721 [Nepenthes gracilis]|uniref:Uncharacterized protein n=1 Tax=Nepenthes gracilis TaxID=150966 RepID=A0AAD3TMY2_NEPGR|nr:hypothetical protein Nepgr_033721 [Nepenthes gracilis]
MVPLVSSLPLFCKRSYSDEGLRLWLPSNSSSSAGSVFDSLYLLPSEVVQQGSTLLGATLVGFFPEILFTSRLTPYLGESGLDRFCGT